MDRRQPDVYLELALTALRKTSTFIGQRSLHEYLADDFCQASVERELEIAGDALGQLRKVDPGVFDQIPDGQVIVAFRNVLAHGYTTLNHQIVYEAATDKAPALLRIVEKLLDAYPEP